MTPERAQDINSRLCRAYFAQSGLSDDPEPDLSDVSFADACEASRIMAAHPGEPSPGGGKIFTTCLANPKTIGLVLVNAILKIFGPGNAPARNLRQKAPE